MEKPFTLFVTSKIQTGRFVVKYQIDNFGALFLLKIKIERESEIEQFSFYRELTLKHLKIVRSSHPRVRL